MGKCSVLVLTIGMAAAGCVPANAAPILAAQFTSSQASVANSTNASFGFSFTATSAIIIDALAYHTPGAGGGAVRLYNSAGTTLASALVLQSDPTATTGGYTYNVAGITPLTLTAGSTYYIAADVPQNSPIILFAAVGLTTVPGVSYGAGVAQAGFGNPLSDVLNQPNSYFTANFEVASATPEPASFGLIGLAGSALLLYRRRQTRYPAR